MSMLPFVTKLLVSDGAQNGTLTVNTNVGFAPGAVIYLKSNTQDIVTLTIVDLIGNTGFRVRSQDSRSYFTFFDTRAYLISEGAMVTQPVQENTAANNDGTRSPLTTRGDLWGYGFDNTRIPVGTDGQVLVADSTAVDGLSWANGGGGSGITAFATVGSVPNASGASVNGSTATLQPADATHPGVITFASQTWAGIKTFLASINLSGNKIINVGDPTGPQDVATKNYVDTHSGTGITALTGDVTATGPGSVAATIAVGVVTAAKMSSGAAATNVGALSGDLSGTLPSPTVVALHETGGPTKLTMAAVADGQVLTRSGATIIGTNPGGSTLIQGTATVDFGPNTGDGLPVAHLDVIGQATIMAGTQIDVRANLAPTADHTQDEIIAEAINWTAGDVIPGVGFTIYGTIPFGSTWGLFTVDWSY